MLYHRKTITGSIGHSYLPAVALEVYAYRIHVHRVVGA